MKVFIDSSVFLRLLLDEPGADKAQDILERVEGNKIVGFITPLVLEEVSFKLIYAKMSELLNTNNIWRIREALRYDEEKRCRCMEVLQGFYDYIEYLYTRGLRIEPIVYNDWTQSLRIIRNYGLLPADALHLAVAERVGVKTIASFDEDFKYVKGIKVIP